VNNGRTMTGSGPGAGDGSGLPPSREPAVAATNPATRAPAAHVARAARLTP
jgi:hypothetical protein